MAKLRNIENEDIINYLQVNQALLKTILWRLEQTSHGGFNQAQKDDVDNHRKFLEEIISTFNTLRSLGN